MLMKPHKMIITHVWLGEYDFRIVKIFNFPYFLQFPLKFILI